jgi:hypothetical protein
MPNAVLVVDVLVRQKHAPKVPLHHPAVFTKKSGGMRGWMIRQPHVHVTLLGLALRDAWDALTALTRCVEGPALPPAVIVKLAEV